MARSKSEPLADARISLPTGTEIARFPLTNFTDSGLPLHTVETLRTLPLRFTMATEPASSSTRASGEMTTARLVAEITTSPCIRFIVESSTKVSLLVLMYRILAFWLLRTFIPFDAAAVTGETLATGRNGFASAMGDALGLTPIVLAGASITAFNCFMRFLTRVGTQPLAQPIRGSLAASVLRSKRFFWMDLLANVIFASTVIRSTPSVGISSSSEADESAMTISCPSSAIMR